MMTRTRGIIAIIALACLVGGISSAYARLGRGDREALLGDELQLTPDMAAWVEGVIAQPGVHIEVFGRYRLVVVARGEQPTGGYGVTVEEIGKDAGTGWIVDVAFIDPGEGSLVTQVISYPHIILAIKDDGADILVRETSGEQPVSLMGQSTGGGAPGADLPFRVGDDLKLTPEMSRWIESVRGEAGVHVKKFGSYNLVAVARGEKPNAGFRVVLEDVSLLDVAPPAPGSGISAPPPDRWFVNVKFVDPAPGDMVAQVISYPYLAVALADNGAAITVQEVSGDAPVTLPVVSAK